MDDDLKFVIANLQAKEDDDALRHLAAALIVHWPELPADIRARIAQTASSGRIVGIPRAPTADIRRRLERLLGEEE